MGRGSVGAEAVLLALQEEPTLLCMPLSGCPGLQSRPPRTNTFPVLPVHGTLAVVPWAAQGSRAKGGGQRRRQSTFAHIDSHSHVYLMSHGSLKKVVMTHSILLGEEFRLGFGSLYLNVEL